MTDDTRAAISESTRLFMLLSDSTNPLARDIMQVILMRIDGLARNGVEDVLTDADLVPVLEAARCAAQGAAPPRKSRAAGGES